jgi:hypothetical protein
MRQSRGRPRATRTRIGHNGARMTEQTDRFETLAVHAGADPDEVSGGV